MSSRIAMNTELLAAASNGDTDEIERLIALGASPNFRDVLDGTTCLHRSVWKGNQAAARRILELGADPNIDAEFTMASPLGIAAFLGNIEMAKLLLAFDARLSKHELRTELLSECRKLGYSDVVHLIESS